MKIGDLARSTGTPVDTIRYYEKAGLMPAPPRTAGNYRAYGPAHAERLAFVRHCRTLNLSLDEIRALLALRDAPQADCGPANAVIDAHQAQVQARLRALRQLQRQLEALRLACNGHGDAAHCGILDGLAHPAHPAH